MGMRSRVGKMPWWLSGDGVHGGQRGAGTESHHVGWQRWGAPHVHVGTLPPFIHSGMHGLVGITRQMMPRVKWSDVAAMQCRYNPISIINPRLCSHFHGRPLYPGDFIKYRYALHMAC